jgi:hypothetical protein
VSPASRLAATFAVQAEACESLGSPLYASLLRRCVADIEAGGPVAAVLRGHENDPGPSGLALRLLGAVHRLVLDGEAAQLAAHYPSVGGDGDAEAAWPALRVVLTEQSARIRPLLEAAPQTNEVGRAAGLLGGLLQLAASFALPIELHEIGSSAGLNLNADAYCYRDADGAHLWGPAGSPVQLVDAWRGPLPPVTTPLEVVRRLGSDVAPLDPADHSHATALQSYVWPDMTPRLERLRAALSVAVQRPTPVDRLDAVAAVQRLEPVAGRVVVLWHSVMWQYIGADSQAAVGTRLDELGGRADEDAPLAHLFLEPTRRGPGAEHEFLLVLQTWPGTRRILASAPGHGLPISWETPTPLR